MTGNCMNANILKVRQRNSTKCSKLIVSLCQKRLVAYWRILPCSLLYIEDKKSSTKQLKWLIRCISLLQSHTYRVWDHFRLDAIFHKLVEIFQHSSKNRISKVWTTNFWSQFSHQCWPRKIWLINSSWIDGNFKKLTRFIIWHWIILKTLKSISMKLEAKYRQFHNKNIKN